MWISWKHEHTDFPDELNFEQKVEIFYEQTLGWHLHIADLVANGGTTFGEFKAGTPGYFGQGNPTLRLRRCPTLPQLPRACGLPRES